MRALHLAIIFLISFLLVNCEGEHATKENKDSSETIAREYYQLKKYTFDSLNQIEVVDQYLREVFLPSVKRQGINNIGVFKTGPNNQDSIPKIYVLIPFKSMDQFLKLDENLSKDQEYQSAAADYLTSSYDEPPYRRIESVLMIAFPDFPVMRPSALSSPRENRVYELRSYESPNEVYFKNKVNMFNEGGEIILFDRLEFNSVFYGEVILGSRMPNLMYMTTFSDQESRDAHWKAFIESPEWVELKAMPKYQNNISHIDIDFLFPTEYSDY